MNLKTIQDKLNEGRSYRDVLEIRALPEEPDEEGRKIVEGYATTFNQPYLLFGWEDYEVWEQVDNRAFDETDMTDVIMQYDHEGRVFARITNQTLRLTVDEHGLLIRADLSGTEIGRQLYEEISGGYTTKMSFGFTVAADERKEENTEDGKTKILRTIKKIGKLFDVSAVSLPANNATEISARAFSEGVIAEAAEERRAAAELELRKRKIKILMEV